MSFVRIRESINQVMRRGLTVIVRMTLWGAVVVATPTATCFAGPCTSQIDALQARIDAALEAKAAGGPSAQESVGATLSHQPTPSSIAAAEEKLHELSAQQVSAVKRAMARARAADAAGDTKACERALAKVQHVLRSGKS
jgi:hypothetical protein